MARRERCLATHWGYGAKRRLTSETYVFFYLFCQLTLYGATTRTRTLGRRLSNEKGFWTQKILNFFCKLTNNIYKFEDCFLRDQAGSNGFKVYNRCIVETSILLGRLQKNLKILFLKKHCDWIIFFQVPRIKQSHYKTLWECWVTWTASGSHKVPSTLMCELTANTVEPHGWQPLVISDTSHLTHGAFFLAGENKCQKGHLLLQDMQGSSQWQFKLSGVNRIMKTRMLLKVLSLTYLEIRYDMRRWLILHKKGISSVAKSFSLPPLSAVEYTSGYLLLYILFNDYWEPMDKCMKINLREIT